MPIRTHCPSCQTQYTLVDALGGKYVRCERCKQSFRADSDNPEPPAASSGIPPTIVTPDIPILAPPVSLNTGESARHVPSPSRLQRPRYEPSRSSGGSGGSAWPWGGVIFAVFLIVRGCLSMSSRTGSSSYDSRPTVRVPQFNQPVFKDKNDGRRFP